MAANKTNFCAVIKYKSKDKIPPSLHTLTAAHKIYQGWGGEMAFREFSARIKESPLFMGHLGSGAAVSIEARELQDTPSEFNTITTFRELQ